MTVGGLLRRTIFYYDTRSNRRSIAYLIVGLVLGFYLTDFITFTTSKKPAWIHHTNHNRIVLADTGKDVGRHQRSHDNNSVAQKLYNEVRVLCWIMTNPNNHHTKARHVQQTWGKRCNKLLFMSSTEDAELGTIALPVAEGRNNLWAKTKAAFRYIYENHMDDADWFFKADDDTYAIVENLRFLLYPYSPETPIYFGFKFKPFVKQGYMSGGAGYVLSKEAVRRLVEEAMPNSKICSPKNSGAEDVEIGKCLENVNVIAGDSRDSHARGRFFSFIPEYHLIPNHANKNYWYWKYIYYKTNEGLNCCSDHAISFHYITATRMHLLDYFIYHLRPYGIVHPLDILPKKLKVGETEPPPVTASDSDVVEAI